MKKVRKAMWHGVVRETLKAQASNLYWILALTGSQWSVLSSDVALTCPGLRRTIRAIPKGIKDSARSRSRF